MMRSTKKTEQQLAAMLGPLFERLQGWEDAPVTTTHNGVEFVHADTSGDQHAVVGRLAGQAVAVVLCSPVRIRGFDGFASTAARIGAAYRLPGVEAAKGFLLPVYFDAILPRFGAMVTAAHYSPAAGVIGRRVASRVIDEAFAYRLQGSRLGARITDVSEWEAVALRNGDCLYSLEAW